MAGVARYEIHRDHAGKFSAAFVATNGITVMTSTKYDTLFAVTLVIEMMREAAGGAEVVDLSGGK